MFINHETCTDACRNQKIGYGPTPIGRTRKNACDTRIIHFSALINKIAILTDQYSWESALEKRQVCLADYSWVDFKQ